MPTTDELIVQYIKLRDYKDKRSKEHTAELEPYVRAMESIENALGAEIIALGEGTQNIKTEHGTVFRRKWTSIKIADRPTFLGFILDDFWQRERFLTSAVTKTEVVEYMDTTNAVPPGLDISSGYDIQVRRA